MEKTHFKRTVLLLIFAVASGVMCAQPLQFPVGATWHYESVTDLTKPPIYRSFTVEKDTVVAGKNARFIRDNYNNSDIVYEENGCVYYYFKDKFRKIYDFNVNVGDTVEFEFLTYTHQSSDLDTTLVLRYKIEKIQTKNIEGADLKEISTVYVGSNPHQYGLIQYVYLEKIGVEHPHILDGGLFTVCPDKATIPENITRLRCYHDTEIDHIADWWAEENKPCDYDYTASVVSATHEKNSIDLYPNPAKDKLTLSGSQYTQDLQIILYDVKGNFIFEKKVRLPYELNIEHLPTGTYFILFFDENAKCLTSNKLIKL